MAKTFLVTLSDKKRGALSRELLEKHVNYLKSLALSGKLKLCGPFTDNDGAMLVLAVETLESAREVIEGDPFIAEGYYGHYSIKEFLEANEGNGWLMKNPQTQGNLGHAVGEGR
ncbi:MAG: YciI family protein [Gammaproteobacteria bacterium]|jgi:uncharacterized protein YciI